MREGQIRIKENAKMTKFFPACTIVFVLFALAGCMGPYESKLPDDPNNQAAVQAFQADIKELPADEQKLVNDFIERMALAKQAKGYGYVVGTRVKEALQNQREWAEKEAELTRTREEAEAKKAKEEAEQKVADDATRSKMLEICNVTLTKKNFQKGNKKKFSADRLSMTLKFDNKGDKEIAGMMGKLEFRDNAGSMLKTIKIPVRESIKAKKSVEWSGDLPCNTEKEDDAKLAKIPLKELKVTWVPDMYTFADGSRMGIGI